LLVSEGTGLLSVTGWQEGDNAMLMIDVRKSHKVCEGGEARGGVGDALLFTSRHFIEPINQAPNSVNTAIVNSSIC